MILFSVFVNEYFLIKHDLDNFVDHNNYVHQKYVTLRKTLMNGLNKIHGLLVTLKSDEPVRTIIYGEEINNLIIALISRY